MAGDKNNLNNRLIIAGLFLLFFLPIAGSWFLVFFTDYKPGSKGTHHGVLINPPIHLEDLQLFDPLSGKTLPLYGSWNMLVIIDGECDNTCMNDLYRMRQIRLATGKEAIRVQRVIYFDNDSFSASRAQWPESFPGQLVLHPGSLNRVQLSWFDLEGVDRQHAIYLIDPSGFLMMGYPGDTDPSGIIKDLKLLLRISKLD